MKRALVLGGGGPVGIAWQTGLLSGLAEAGVSLANADLILGTSAGAYVGAKLALLRDVGALARADDALEAQRNETPSPGAGQPLPDMRPMMTVLAKRELDAPLPVEPRLELARMALAAETESETEFVERVAICDEDTAWPAGYACTAIDTDSGELVIWGLDRSAPLRRAVASSCAVPTVFPPITIGDRRYIDGGMRSGTNADLVTGYDRVLVVAVVPPMLALYLQPRLDAELAQLRADGAQAMLVVPDAESGQAFGPSLMDTSRHAEVRRAGHAQGLTQAARVGELWRP